LRDGAIVSKPKKPGFLPFLSVVTRLLSKKPGFRLPAPQTKETGFLAVAIGFNAVFSSKTRFLTARASIFTF
jgi:hypothetical protein